MSQLTNGASLPLLLLAPSPSLPPSLSVYVSIHAKQHFEHKSGCMLAYT